MEAIRALAAFGQHGKAPQAAAEILKSLRDYNTWMIDQSPEGQMKQAAVDAFRSMPAKDVLPAVMEALKSDSANTRLFAVVWVLPPLGLPKGDVTRAMQQLLKDPDLSVRVTAAYNLLSQAGETPAVIDVLREALASENPLISGYAQSSVAALLQALNDEKQAAGADAALNALGSAAIPALESILKSGSGQLGIVPSAGGKPTHDRAREILEKLRATQSEKK
jgi:hypothetical protein